MDKNENAIDYLRKQHYDFRREFRQFVLTMISVTP